MSARILILTAGFGEGHNAAARALAVACDDLHGPGTAHVADIYNLAAPRLNGILRRGYLQMINRAPRAWAAAYRWIDQSKRITWILRRMSRERQVIDRLIGRERPEAICCTYPTYAFLLDELAQRGRVTVPFFNIVTDSISINSLWWRAGASGWFLPNEDSVSVMRQAGVDARSLHVTGFPVPGFFEANARRLTPPELSAGSTPRVLYIINSRTPGAIETARRLLKETNWEVTCTVGRNDVLRKELESLAAARSTPARILGWTDEIPKLLMTHHVVVSKAGGATTQEALAARCPMIVNQVVPGQEEGNYELLRRHGVGALAETPERVLAELQRAFADGGEVWRTWRKALGPLSKPRAAHDIATHVFSQISSSEDQEPIPLPFRTTAVSA
jgi:processive 1,2-diacylglycerol beta-glucosyltransferase